MRINRKTLPYIVYGLGILALWSGVGCGYTVVPPVNPRDEKATEPAHVRLQAGSIFAPIKYESTKNLQAKAEYDPETQAFKLEMNSDAATVNETITKLAAQVNELNKTFNEGLASVERQTQIQWNGVQQFIAQVGANFNTTLGTLISAVTGKPYTPGAQISIPPPLSEMEVRQIVAEQLKAQSNLFKQVLRDELDAMRAELIEAMRSELAKRGDDPPG